jgi:asparagine synthase (glutamine-hydrolysing)
VGADLGEPDTVGLAQFLSFLWIPDPRTPYRDAKSLEPRHAITWSRDGVKKFAYTEALVGLTEEDFPSADTAVEEAGDRFRAAAQRQLMADVPIGLMASGGVDSGLIWWAAADGLARAFTIEWPGRDGKEKLQEDVDAVRALEARFGTPVDYLPGDKAEAVALPPSGDLFADPAYELTRLIARSAREQDFKVLMSGQGGDELLGGYRRHAVARLMKIMRRGGAGQLVARGLQRVPIRGLSAEYTARVLRAMAQRDDFSAYMYLCTYSTAQERAQTLGCTEAEVSDEVVWQRHREVFDRLPKDLSFFRKVLALDLAVYMPGLGLAYVDRAGMEFSVEIRVPWLDLDFVRWSLRVPESLLVKRGRGKWLTRELAARELSSDLGHRPKRAFAAPAEKLDPGRDGTGERGFRQGIQFARARRILREFLDNSPLQGSSAGR